LPSRSLRSSACSSSCSRILFISAAGGRIGVADPADDLLIAADDDPLGYQVLGEHAFEIGLVDRDVFGVAASGFSVDGLKPGSPPS